MTFEFDALMSIYNISTRNAALRPVAEWLADLCVKEASRKMSYEEWKRTARAKAIITVYGEEELKWEFLEECHDRLDHGPLHHKVFQPSTVMLIEVIYNLFTGKPVPLKSLKAGKRTSELMELLRKAGAKEDGAYLQLQPS